MTARNKWADWLIFGGEMPKLHEDAPEVPMPVQHKSKNTSCMQDSIRLYRCKVCGVMHELEDLGCDESDWIND